MPKAENEHTASGDREHTPAEQHETAEPSRYPMSDIEMELGSLRLAAALLGHVATSTNQVGEEELLYLQEQIVAHHDRLNQLWEQAFNDQRREHEKHKAELEAARARTAPGSEAEVKRVEALWSLAVAWAKTVLEQAPVPALVQRAESGRA